MTCWGKMQCNASVYCSASSSETQRGTAQEKMLRGGIDLALGFETVGMWKTSNAPWGLLEKKRSVENGQSMAVDIVMSKRR